MFTYYTFSTHHLHDVRDVQVIHVRGQHLRLVPETLLPLAQLIGLLKPFVTAKPLGRGADLALSPLPDERVEGLEVKCGDVLLAIRSDLYFNAAT